MINKWMFHTMLLNVGFLFGQQELLTIVKDFPSPNTEVTSFLQQEKMFNIGTFFGPIKHVAIKTNNYEEGSITSDSNINVDFDVNGKRIGATSLGHIYVLDELCNCDLDEGGDSGIYKTIDTIDYVKDRFKENLVVEPISIDEETGALELKPNQWFKDGILIKQVEEDVMTKYVFDTAKKLKEKHGFIRDYLEDSEDENTLYVSEFYKNTIVRAKYDARGNLKKVKHYGYFQDEFFINETSYGYNEKNQLVSYVSKEHNYYDIDVDESVALDEQPWFENKEPIIKREEQSWTYENGRLIRANFVSNNVKDVCVQTFTYEKSMIIVDEYGKEIEEDKQKEYKSRSEYRYDNYNNLVSFVSFNIEDGKEKLIMDAKLKIEYY